MVHKYGLFQAFTPRVGENNMFGAWFPIPAHGIDVIVPAVSKNWVVQGEIHLKFKGHSDFS